MSKKPNYAFIDSQNLNLGVKSLGWALDFKKFRVYLETQYKIKKAYLFIGHVSGNEKLYRKLQEFGYVLIFKPTLKFNEKGFKKIKGNVDAELVMYTIVESRYYYKAILASGDGDFYCLLEYLVKRNKLLKIIVPNYRYSSLFRGFEKYILPIPSIKGKVEKKRRGVPAA
jgi:uncharacterized LabA/DUF88 family protein